MCTFSGHWLKQMHSENKNQRHGDGSAWLGGIHSKTDKIPQVMRNAFSILDSR